MVYVNRHQAISQHVIHYFCIQLFFSYIKCVILDDVKNVPGSGMQQWQNFSYLQIASTLWDQSTSLQWKKVVNWFLTAHHCSLKPNYFHTNFSWYLKIKFFTLKLVFEVPWEIDFRQFCFEIEKTNKSQGNSNFDCAAHNWLFFAPKLSEEALWTSLWYFCNDA